MMPGEKDLPNKHFEQTRMKEDDEDPKLYFARLLKGGAVLKRIGEPRSPEQIASVALRNLSTRQALRRREAHPLGYSDKYRQCPRL